jgi:hypothetical protein
MKWEEINCLHEMKYLFVTYELSVKLKEKGFDEGCSRIYDGNGKLDNDLFWSNFGIKNSCIHLKNNAITAPLYQQITDWFRDKHNLHFYITPYGDMRTWSLGGLEGWELPNIGRIDKKEREDRLFFDLRAKYQGVKFNTYYDALNTAIEEALKLI